MNTKIEFSQMKFKTYSFFPMDTFSTCIKELAFVYHAHKITF